MAVFLDGTEIACKNVFSTNKNAVKEAYGEGFLERIDKECKVNQKGRHDHGAKYEITMEEE